MKLAVFPFWKIAKYVTCVGFITPSLYLPVPTNSTNNKRAYDPTEEMGLDYSSPVNPFSMLDYTNFYDLDSEFFTPNHPESHTAYRTLELSDLQIHPESDINKWLPEICDYLSFENTETNPDHKYSLKVIKGKHSTNAPTDQLYDFDDYMDQTISLKWNTDQFVVFQKGFPNGMYNKDNTYYYGCRQSLIDSDPELTYTFTPWINSDFYINYAGDHDDNLYHSPHTSQFSDLQYEFLDPITYSKPTNDNPVYLQYYLPLQLDNAGASVIGGNPKNPNTLGDIISNNSQASSKELSQRCVFSPTDALGNTMLRIYVGENSSDESLPMIINNGWIQKNIFDANNNIGAIFTDQDVYQQANIDKFIARGASVPTYFKNYYPQINPDIDKGDDKRGVEFTLPATQKFEVPKSAQDNVLSFSDYYIPTTASGITCDIDIDSAGTLSYTLRSGSLILDHHSEECSPQFLDYLNFCASPVQTKEDGTLVSSGLNNIQSLHVSLPITTNEDFIPPFVQNINTNLNGINTSKKIQSSGFSVTLNDKAKDNHPIPQFNYVNNFAQVTSNGSGTSNTIMTNLDYLLAIDPTTTDTWSTSSTNSTVKVYLNPYYICAAANAYSAYNYWLSFDEAHAADWNSLGVSSQVAKAIFRDLILRGFIKSAVDADNIFSKVKTARSFSPLFSLTSGILDQYKSLVLQPNFDPDFISSFVQNKSSHSVEFTPTTALNWKMTSFTSSQFGKYSQAQWAPFLVDYKLSPRTFSFLMSIPSDYTFTIPYGEVTPTTDPKSSSIHSLTNTMTSQSISWKDLLAGDSLEFPLNLDQNSNVLNNKSLILGCNNSYGQDTVGIYTSTSTNNTQVEADDGGVVTLTVPSYNNIKLATISDNQYNGSDTTTSTHLSAKSDNIIPAQLFSSSINRSNYICDKTNIPYLPEHQSHSVVAFHDDNLTLNPTSDGVLSNNTYCITKFNQEITSDTFAIDQQGNLGVEVNYNNFRNSLLSVDPQDPASKKYYYSRQTNLTGQTSPNDPTSWLMKGVAPEDWFSSSYMTTAPNGYRQYQWAFHPTGLWGYNVPFTQDLDTPIQTEDMSFGDLALDYTLWGMPEIIPIYKQTFVPTHVKQAFRDIWNATSIRGSFCYGYTHNASSELAFELKYTSLKFTNQKGQTVTPVQYVYFPDCFYNLQFNSPTEQKISINALPNTNKLYGDFSPSNFSDYVDNYQDAIDDSDYYSTSQIDDILSCGEIINWYNSSYPLYFAKCNVDHPTFMQLYQHGWLTIADVLFDDPNHKLTFTIYYKDQQLSEYNTDLYSTTPPVPSHPDDYMYINKNYTKADPDHPEIKVEHKVLTNDEIHNPDWKTLKIEIDDFRCIGTDYSTVTNKHPASPMLIGLIVFACIMVPVIGLTIFGLVRYSKKHKQIK